MFVGVKLFDAPGVGKKQDSVNRQAVVVAPDFDGVRVQQVALAVGPVGVAVQAIGPGSKKRDSGLRWFLFPFVEPRRGHENRLAAHSQVVSDVADGRANGDIDRVRRIRQANRFDRIDGYSLRGAGFGHGEPLQENSTLEKSHGLAAHGDALATILAP